MIWPYLTRTLPIWTVFAVFVCFYLAISWPNDARISQLVLTAYVLILHAFALAFSLRLCWALESVLRLTTIEPDEEGGYEEPVFVIILPSYQESIETLANTLSVLASHPLAKRCYHIYLAMEAREAKSRVKAESLASRFDSCFSHISITVHPADIPGEAAGKSSNEAWAANCACSDYAYASPELRNRIIFTTMDADSHIPFRYFSEIARLHHTYPEDCDATIYVPPLIFDRNLDRVPLPVRAADLMWAGAGLSSLYCGSDVCIPTSVYSLPLILVERAGGWDTGPGAIGEDMHMYLKCFFACAGHLKSRPVYAPVSQCNVAAPSYISNLSARYRQALRHMWGSLDTGYAVRQAALLAQPRLLEIRATPASLLPSNEVALVPIPSRPASPVKPSLQRIQLRRSLILSLRLVEAHFIPLHMVLIVVASSLCPTRLLPELVQQAFIIAAYFRTISFAFFILYFIRFSTYHKQSVSLRQQDMEQAKIESMFTRTIFPTAGWLEILTFPIAGAVFGALPALHAAIMHLWTDQLGYVVSLKPGDG
ncbi:hypothetical protein K470DRAFT_256236 [Piedraia hortae CBS 480.64]|uniref:Glycosyltransferase 2-like domain-containing protein n=1 Tax=Piedraia hortae CBS 480.64 TaxID=1314780 RepID=A0A6A7C4H6_9PEZI|nr:hypothetical protein K470DRAFT_256236 [Piedraia hortae CBS 480.64]